MTDITERQRMEEALKKADRRKKELDTVRRRTGIARAKRALTIIWSNRSSLRRSKHYSVLFHKKHKICARQSIGFASRPRTD